MKASFLKRWRVRLIVIGLVVAGAAVWWFTRTPPAPPKPPSGVVALGDVTQTVQAAGVLQAKTKVDVGAQVSGQVQTLHVELGQQVKKGELLVSLDPELARSDVAQAEAAVAQASAAIDSRRVDAEAARLSLIHI